VLTSDVNINVFRVESREATGGHGVPEDKIRSRYVKALKLIPELVEIADVMHIYDNSTVPFRIFKKRKTEYFIWDNDHWSKESIRNLAGEKNTTGYC
jgi:predicted ABC-type ATPase